MNLLKIIIIFLLAADTCFAEQKATSEKHVEANFFYLQQQLNQTTSIAELQVKTEAQELEIKDLTETLKSQQNEFFKLKQNQKIFDEKLKHQQLRKELLDRQENSINNWLAVIGIVLTMFGLLVPVGAWLLDRNFKKRTDEIDKHIEEINQLKQQAKLHVEEISKLREFSAEQVKDNPEKADKAVAEIVKDESSSTIDKLIAEAIKLQRKSNYEESIQQWQLVLGAAIQIKDSQLQVIANVNKGYLFEQLKLHNQAVEAYQQAIKLNPEYSEAYNNLGIAYGKLEKFDQAVEAYQQAIKLNPEHSMAYYNLGNAYGKLEKFDQAIEAYQQAIKLNPEYSMAYINLFELRLISKNSLGVELKKKFEDNISDPSALMVFEMLNLLEISMNSGLAITQKQKNNFIRRFSDQSFTNWDWTHLENWIAQQKSNKHLQEALDFFKNF